ncbi:3-methyl-2-oxobutanoate hydroxymethyltransferase [Limisalsivibrio acetivorans]|uniref:3-methyl-2-oxobutanoate hydroxymethyltransferase n=1 Tax=Limisalsivibrio acetivorans TaxID=1304888 RepID=UPI0003B65A69|nr:3-methyl-2-oxobutanoate hydroxymethyltransferase [Limisalsivibrio acetivorans]
MSKHSEIKKITVNHFAKMKQENEKITCLTAYDYTSAMILDEAGIELVLVGDSLGVVMNGYENTIPVTLDEVIYHTKAVKRGLKRSFLVLDMPFGTYHESEEKALTNCIRAIKESGAEAVKIEGGAEKAPLVKKLVNSGINVMGHIGLMPQSIHTMGGFKVQGRDGVEKYIEDAKALEEAGIFSLVLEGLVADVATSVTKAVDIPTIGIGAGKGCDGQILVFHDVFGLFDDFIPKFVKRYADAKTELVKAAQDYIGDVKSSVFPDDKHSYLR